MTLSPIYSQNTPLSEQTDFAKLILRYLETNRRGTMRTTTEGRPPRAIAHPSKKDGHITGYLPTPSEVGYHSVDG